MSSMNIGVRVRKVNTYFGNETVPVGSTGVVVSAPPDATHRNGSCWFWVKYDHWRDGPLDNGIYDYNSKHESIFQIIQDDDVWEKDLVVEV